MKCVTLSMQPGDLAFFVSTCVIFSAAIMGCTWCLCRIQRRAQLMAPPTPPPTPSPPAYGVKHARVYAVVDQPGGDYALASRTVKEKKMSRDHQWEEA